MQLASTQLKELDSADAFEGMTPAQYRFAINTFSGLNYTDAYRAAFDCGDMTPDQVSKAASRLSMNGRVVAKVKSLRLATEREATLVSKLTRNWILDGVMNLAISADKDSVKLAAYGMLGKTVGIDLFRESSIVERVTRTPDQVDSELRDKLAALRETVTIEGKARQVAAPKPEPDKPRRKRRT